MRSIMTSILIMIAFIAPAIFPGIVTFLPNKVG
jgi:hypothetical protein